jgi:peptide/nickel transport system ATP-binding protein
MYAGRIVETTSAERLFAQPEHPYTWGLLKSIPTLGGPREEALVPIPGAPPSLIHRPSGCHFHPRCAYAQPEHARVDPRLEQVPSQPNHHVACLLSSEERRRLWDELQRGRTPVQALSEVGLPVPPSTEAGLPGLTETAPSAPALPDTAPREASLPDTAPSEAGLSETAP